MSLERKPWKATEGLERATIIVQNLVEDAPENRSHISDQMRHHMTDVISFAIDAALQDGPSRGHANGPTPVVYGDLNLGAQQLGNSDTVGAVVHNEDVPRKTRGPKRKAGRGRKPAAGADA